MAGAVALTGLPLDASAGGDGPLLPVRLSTEHLVEPLGIDAPAPRFGWQLTADGTDRRQSAYEILVAADPQLRTVVWDSGKVTSAEQTARVYGGPPLRSRTRYHWAVRAWDERGLPGPLSSPAWFETALLSGNEWTADWVGSGEVVPSPPRIGPQRLDQSEALLPGQKLGQSFVSASAVAAVALMLAVPRNESAGCRITVRRNGVVVGEAELSDLTGDKFGLAQGRLDLDEAAGPGNYLVELSSPRGSVGWVTGEEGRWFSVIPPNPPANPLLRKEFRLAEPVASARLYLSGLGHAVAWVNGRQVDDLELSPVGTDYDKRLLYTTHDVTGLLRSGSNALGIALGRGFFATRSVDTDGTNHARWIAEPQLKAQLEITLASGRRVTVASGRDWSLTEGPTTYEGIHAGESYDARRARQLDGWSSSGFDARDWRPVAVVASPGPRLEAYPGEHIRAARPIEPVRTTRPADGVRVYDFGVVTAGSVRLRGRLPASATIRIRYAEKLAPSGRIEPGTPGAYENIAVDGRFQVDEYTATGRGVESWQPAFTYKGFQYVEVTGTDAPPDIVAIPVRSDLRTTMAIKLNHPELQGIVTAFRRTAENGLHGYPDVSPFTKQGWLGTVRNAALPMVYQFGTAALFDHWLDDIRVAQAPDGGIPGIAPFGGDFAVTAPSYTGLYAHLVRSYWLVHGDRTVPAKHFESIRRGIEWTLGTLVDDIGDDLFGDWYPPGVQGYPRGPEGGRLVGTAHVIQTLRDGTALAELLGHTDVAAAWRSRTERIIRRFNEEFLDTSAGLYRTELDVGYRQTSNAIPLAYDLVPASQVDRVVANLVADVEALDRHLNTGSMGTGTLVYALSDHGRADLAVAVLGQRSYPSYGYLRSLGATTFWEKWEADARSHNDPTLSAPVQWLVERVAGVEALEPGWARFRVAPRVFDSLPGAGIALDTVRGRIEARWRDGLMVVRVPVNAVAEVRLKNGETVELGSGLHQLKAN